MKAKDVKIGERYVAKVSGKLTTVKILRESPYGGWDAENTESGRSVRVKTAGRLRGPAFNARKFEAALAADCKATDEKLRRTFAESASPGDAARSIQDLFKF